MISIWPRIKKTAPHHFDVSKEFSVILEKNTAENFCDLILEKMKNYERVHVDMRQCHGGVSAGFLYRTFDGILSHYTPDDILNKLIISSYEPTDILMIGYFIKPSLQEKKINKIMKRNGDYDHTSVW